jgi:Ca2+-binding EF-hand superfamily protein
MQTHTEYVSSALALPFIVAICCALCAANALSAQPPRPGPMTFSVLDQNGDGAVTEQEFAAARAERMATRAAQNAPMRGAAKAPAFSDFDTDGDGRMSADEFAAGREARMQSRSGIRARPGPGMGAGGAAGRRAPTFAEFDLNGDGGLTKQEFYDVRAQRMRERAQLGFPMSNAANAPTFEAVDSNADGVISPPEFAQSRAAHRQQMIDRP